MSDLIADSGVGGVVFSGCPLLTFWCFVVVVEFFDCFAGFAFYVLRLCFISCFTLIMMIFLYIRGGGLGYFAGFV